MIANWDNGYKKFIISDYKGFLKQGEGNKRHYYYCPNCGKLKLSINADGQKYDCYNCHDTSAIASILVKQANEMSEKEKVKNPKTIKISTQEWIYTDIEGKPVIKVKRVNKDGDKDVYQYSLVNGKWVTGLKGVTQKDASLLYIKKVKEAVTNNEPIFIAEGETCVDSLTNLGFTATTNLGGSGKNYEAYSILSDYPNIIICPDRDGPGVKHANQIAEVLPQAKFLYANPNSDIWKLNICVQGGGYDIKDWIEYLKIEGLTEEKIKEQIITNIEDNPRNLIMIDRQVNDNNKVNDEEKLFEIIEEAKQIILDDSNDDLTTNVKLEALRSKSKISSYIWESKFIKPLMRDLKNKKLKLEISNYINEQDIFQKVLIKQKICSNYQISSADFKLLVNNVSYLQSTPDKTIFSFEELINLQINSENWLIPNLLPRGEMLLLTAPPKVGKSLLASDITYSVLGGDTILGEKCNKGKILYVGSDESLTSLARRFQNRGLDLLPEAVDNLKVMSHLDLSDLTILEQELEDYKPSLVIIDSLTSVTNNLGISENDADFARQIYKLKDCLKKYNASSILIHHENKSPLASGMQKISGSARIPAAVWGIAQLSGKPQDEDSAENQNTTRILSLQPREGEKISWQLNINPKDSWTEKGIFEFLFECSDPNGDKKTQASQVVSLLNSKKIPLEYAQINSYLNFGRSLYTILDRLCNRKLINRRRSPHNKRKWQYFTDSFNDDNSQQDIGNNIANKTEKENISITPSFPTPTQNSVKLTDTINSQSIENKGFESNQQSGQLISQQLINNDLISLISIEGVENSYNQDLEIVIEVEEILVNTSNTERGGGISENVNLDNEENVENSNCQNSPITENNISSSVNDEIEVLETEVEDNISSSVNNEVEVLETEVEDDISSSVDNDGINENNCIDESNESPEEIEFNELINEIKELLIEKEGLTTTEARKEWMFNFAKPHGNYNLIKLFPDQLLSEIYSYLINL